MFLFRVFFIGLSTLNSNTFIYLLVGFFITINETITIHFWFPLINAQKKIEPAIFRVWIILLYQFHGINRCDGKWKLLLSFPRVRAPNECRPNCSVLCSTGTKKKILPFIVTNKGRSNTTKIQVYTIASTPTLICWPCSHYIGNNNWTLRAYWANVWKSKLKSAHFNCIEQKKNRNINENDHTWNNAVHTFSTTLNITVLWLRFHKTKPCAQPKWIKILNSHMCLCLLITNIKIFLSNSI